jgi:hypothetical protein
LKVAAVRSFSECVTTMVASSSITSTGRPSPSSSGMPATSDAGNACPLCSARCAHATARARARACAISSRSALVIAFSSRQQVESEATGPKTADWSANVAMSLMHSPPSASITATSVSTRPGSCAVCGAGRCANAADSCAVSVVWSARSAISREPACDTTPVPSADTSTAGRVRVACTWKVPSCPEFRVFDKLRIPYRQGTFDHLHVDTNT